MGSEKKEQEKKQNNIKDDIQFDEAQAFFELLLIIQQAMESQDISAFESNVSHWQKNYPIEKFSPYFKSRIKYLLSKSYLRTILILPIEIKMQQEFKQDKAYSDLCIIVHRAKLHKDLSKLNNEINKWKSANPIDKFNTYYKPRINRLINPNNFYKITGAFDQQTAYQNLEKIIEDAKRNQNQDEFNTNLDNWHKQYNPKDFSNEYSSKVNSLLREDSLSSIIKPLEDTSNVDPLSNQDLTVSILTVDNIKRHVPLNQQSAYFELLDVFKNPKDITGIFNWAYKYRLIIDRFDDQHKEAILSLISDYYYIPKQSTYQIPDISETNWDDTLNKNNYTFSEAPTLSLDNFKEMNSLRKQTIIQFFAMLLNNQPLSEDDHSRFRALHKQSEDSLQLVSFLEDEKDDISQIKPFIEEEELFVVSPIKLFIEEDVLDSLDNINTITSEREMKTTLDHPSSLETNSELNSLPEKNNNIDNSEQFELNFRTQLLKDEDETNEGKEEDLSLDDSDPSSFFRNLIN